MVKLNNIDRASQKRHGTRKYGHLKTIFDTIKLNPPKLKNIEEEPSKTKRNRKIEKYDDHNLDEEDVEVEHEENADDELKSYDERKQSNRKVLKGNVQRTIDKLSCGKPTDLLLKHSKYGLSEHDMFVIANSKLKAIYLNSTKTRTELSKKETCDLFNFSFDQGFGGAAFVNFTWQEIVDSEVCLDDTEIVRIILAKMIFRVISPELCPSDPVEPVLMSLDLNTSIAEFELRGLGEFPVRLFIPGIDCALVCCISEQARNLCVCICRQHVQNSLANALSDGNSSHSSFEVFGVF
jgi:hypothetical protein